MARPSCVDELVGYGQEHERVLGQVPDAGRVLLKPHMDDIEARLRPGAYLLTWTSLNIDGYLHHLHTVSAPISLKLLHTEPARLDQGTDLCIGWNCVDSLC